MWTYTHQGRTIVGPSASPEALERADQYIRGVLPDLREPPRVVYTQLFAASAASAKQA